MVTSGLTVQRYSKSKIYLNNHYWFVLYCILKYKQLTISLNILNTLSLEVNPKQSLRVTPTGTAFLGMWQLMSHPVRSPHQDTTLLRHQQPLLQAPLGGTQWNLKQLFLTRPRLGAWQLKMSGQAQHPHLTGQARCTGNLQVSQHSLTGVLASQHSRTKFSWLQTSMPTEVAAAAAEGRKREEHLRST